MTLREPTQQVDDSAVSLVYEITAAIQEEVLNITFMALK